MDGNDYFRSVYRPSNRRPPSRTAALEDALCWIVHHYGDVLEQQVADDPAHQQEWQRIMQLLPRW